MRRSNPSQFDVIDKSLDVFSVAEFRSGHQHCGRSSRHAPVQRSARNGRHTLLFVGVLLNAALAARQRMRFLPSGLGHAAVGQAASLPRPHQHAAALE